MTLIDSYRALNETCGIRANILIEPTVRRYSFESGPTVTYRIHVWLDRGMSIAFHFCKESEDLESLTYEAVEAFNAWTSPALADIADLSQDLERVAAA